MLMWLPDFIFKSMQHFNLCFITCNEKPIHVCRNCCDSNVYSPVVCCAFSIARPNSLCAVCKLPVFNVVISSRIPPWAFIIHDAWYPSKQCNTRETQSISKHTRQILLWCLHSHFTVDKENSGLQKMSMRILSQNHKTARENKHGIFIFSPCSTIWLGRNSDCIMYYETEYGLNSSNGRILARTTVSAQLPWWSLISCQDEKDGGKKLFFFFALQTSFSFTNTSKDFLRAIKMKKYKVLRI